MCCKANIGILHPKKLANCEEKCYDEVNLVYENNQQLETIVIKKRKNKDLFKMSSSSKNLEEFSKTDEIEEDLDNEPHKKKTKQKKKIKEKAAKKPSNEKEFYLKAVKAMTGSNSVSDKKTFEQEVELETKEGNSQLPLLRKKSKKTERNEEILPVEKITTNKKKNIQHNKKLNKKHHKKNHNNNSNSKKHKKKHSITNNLSKSKSTENKNSKPFEQEQPITQATKSISVSKVIKDKSLFEQELPIKLNSQDKNKSKNPKLESKIKKAKKKYKHYKKKILKKRNKKKMKKVIKTNK